jgi:HK97 gp10 family phage protein
MSAKSHSDRLKRMVQKTPQQVARALYQAGQLIELDAERSITAGSISGAGHIPSLPGQPPNNDTGGLVRSIETKIGGPNLVIVEAGGPSAPYATYLEWGTATLSPRPFMRPATEKNRKRVAQMVGDAVSLTIK